MPGWCGWLDGQTAGAVVTRLPVALAHVDDLDFAAAAGGMHEARFAEVDADMGKRPAQRVEEHQIAGLQLGAVNAFSNLADFLGIAG